MNLYLSKLSYYSTIMNSDNACMYDTNGCKSRVTIGSIYAIHHLIGCIHWRLNASTYN